MEIGKDIHYAARLLTGGELVAIPTETVYGLAGNGLDTDAIARIYAAKKRPSFNPLILHLSSKEQVASYAAQVPDGALVLMKKFWPGPLTIVLPKKPNVPDLLTAGLNAVALRVPQHPLTLELLQLLEFPLAAPSANPFGYISPTSPLHVAAHEKMDVRYVLDGGSCSVGLESTIIKFDADQPVLLRYGVITQEQIEETLHQSVSTYRGTGIEAPGMSTSHYAPAKKLVIGDVAVLQQKYAQHPLGVLTFTPRPKLSSAVMQLSLTQTGLMTEAAKNFFHFLRLLDNSPAEIILCEPVPLAGIGLAIHDKMLRASFQK